MKEPEEIYMFESQWRHTKEWWGVSLFLKMQKGGQVAGRGFSSFILKERKWCEIIWTKWILLPASLTAACLWNSQVMPWLSQLIQPSLGMFFVTEGREPLFPRALCLAFTKLFNDYCSCVLQCRKLRHRKMKLQPGVAVFTSGLALLLPSREGAHRL